MGVDPRPSTLGVDHHAMRRASTCGSPLRSAGTRTGSRASHRRRGPAGGEGGSHGDVDGRPRDPTLREPSPVGAGHRLSSGTRRGRPGLGGRRGGEGREVRGSPGPVAGGDGTGQDQHAERENQHGQAESQHEHSTCPDVPGPAGSALPPPHQPAASPPHGAGRSHPAAGPSSAGVTATAASRHDGTRPPHPPVTARISTTTSAPRRLTVTDAPGGAARSASCWTLPGGSPRAAARPASRAASRHRIWSAAAATPPRLTASSRTRAGRATASSAVTIPASARAGSDAWALTRPGPAHAG